MASIQSILHLDRRIIYLLVGLGTILPIVFPLNLPVSVTPPVSDAFNAIEALEEGDLVLVSFDYGPSSAPENDPMAEAILRHCFVKNLRVVAMALYPLGGLTMVTRSVGRVAAEFPEAEYGVDYINLGYKDGGQATMKRMGANMHEVFPQDVRGAPVENFPIMGDVRNYADVKIVASLATGIIGEWWANLVNAQFGTPVIVGPTAVSAAKYYAYYKSGQMVGLLGGLKGASEYEKLLMDRYPQVRPTYGSPGVYTAHKGMDVQSVVHVIMVLFIILGNIAYFAGRRAEQARQA